MSNDAFPFGERELRSCLVTAVTGIFLIGALVGALVVIGITSL